MQLNLPWHPYSDRFLEQTHRVLAYGRALPRDVSSLRNWMKNGSLSRDERKYLDSEQDLINLTSPSDAARKNLEDWVEDLLVDHWKGFRSVWPPNCWFCLFRLVNTNEGLTGSAVFSSD